MPRYEYRCRACGAVFEEFRAMDAADAPAPCPQGHDDTSRLLSVFATVGRAGGGQPRTDARRPLRVGLRLLPELRSQLAGTGGVVRHPASLPR